MTIDYRALCAELADALDHNRQCLMDDRSLTHPLADRARAALAQPEPEVVGPTRDELWELWLRLDRELPDRPAAVAEFWEHAQIDACARWGHHPKPVPVNERLPGPEDCDAEGRCWWFAAETEVDFGAWTFGTPEACTGDNWGHTHWLPATALPLPQGGVQP